MEHSNLDQTELNKRANEVFILERDEYIYDLYINDEGEVKMPLRELADDGDYVDCTYEPDMTDRPQALDYLMGKRDDFHD